MSEGADGAMWTPSTFGEAVRFALPIIPVIEEYTRDNLRTDMVAGITIGVGARPGRPLNAEGSFRVCLSMRPPFICRLSSPPPERHLVLAIPMQSLLILSVFHDTHTWTQLDTCHAITHVATDPSTRPFTSSGITQWRFDDGALPC